MSTNAYDQLPYPNRAHKLATARKLEAVATLFGMKPPSVSKCRVLELGCAAGGNLIPQALAASESEFLGVELSARQVDDGLATIAAIGLDNIELRHADLLSIDSSWGQFDYILCHGVYSWVPANVRAKILTICKENLSPNGVALVSYNVLPGWHFRGAIREMMLYHVSQFEQPTERISQARAILDFMSDNCPADTAYGKVLREELDIVRSADDHYLFHDHLEEHNHAVYFHQFIEDAEKGGLMYLADSNVASMLPKSHSSGAQNALAGAPQVKQEQYMDFLRNNTFRSTLLCHQGTQLTRPIERDALRRFHVSLTSRPAPFEVDFGSKEPLAIRIGAGQIRTNSPGAMVLFEQLTKCWPRSITIDELHAAASERLSSSGQEVQQMSADDVADAMMDVFATGLLELCLEPPAITNVVSSRPMATQLARWQASAGNTVTNQRNESVTLDEFSRFLVKLLDAKHDRAMLAEKMQAAVASGELTWPENVQAKLEDLIDAALVNICNTSLLIA